MGEFPVDDLMALDLEYRLTIGFRMARPGSKPCECVGYLIERREVLIPEVLRLAAEKDEDPVDYFAAFARRLHARHAEPTP